MEPSATIPKVTLYLTVLNEEATIQDFLNSLHLQSRPPDEIVIIDGGSMDRTKEIVESHAEHGAPIRLLALPGSSVAQGRNAGFKAARFELVASSDGGCRLHPDWLARLLYQMRNEVDIVSGVFVPDPKSRFEECVGDLMYEDVSRLPDDWSMPSHRSVLIRKSVWEALGGFPEHLYRSEDTWFNQEARKRGFRFRLARDAVVFWRPRQTLAEVFRNSYLWTRSDAEFGIHGPSISISAARGVLRLAAKTIAVLSAAVTIVFVPLPFSLLAIPFFARALVRVYPKEWSVRKTATKNAIHLAIDFARILGWLSGTWRKRFTHRR